MTATITFPAHGRGAWPAAGTGGTLNGAGSGPGPYYRAPAAGGSAYPGIAGYRAEHAVGPSQVSIDAWAVYRTVQWIQREVGAVADGLYGNDTARYVKAWQAKQALEADGIYGPASANKMVKSFASKLSVPSYPIKILYGTIKMESNWDPGAVGYMLPKDLGIAQINITAHTFGGYATGYLDGMDFALNPRKAVPWMIKFIEDNMLAMNWVIEDGIAAYNLGVTGAKAWVKAGKPAVWNGIYVRSYIDRVLAGG